MNINPKVGEVSECLCRCGEISFNTFVNYVLHGLDYSLGELLWSQNRLSSLIF
jgi:hypothetical protein